MTATILSTSRVSIRCTADTFLNDWHLSLTLEWKWWRINWWGGSCLWQVCSSTLTEHWNLSGNAVKVDISLIPWLFLQSSAGFEFQFFFKAASFICRLDTVPGKGCENMYVSSYNEWRRAKPRWMEANCPSCIIKSLHCSCRLYLLTQSVITQALLLMRWTTTLEKW